MAEHICPVWIGYFLANPLRKLAQSPQKILQPFIQEGDTVLDFGCAMGFFSLPMAGMVGERGKVICLDVQERMLDKLQRRAERASLLNRFALRRCEPENLNIEDMNGQIDFALAFAVVHEVPNQHILFTQLYDVLKEGGQLLVAEPSWHVSQEDFAHSVIAAKHAGFAVCDDPIIPKSRAVVFAKNSMG